jgi:uncharacterized protein YcbK (DUF882 family)
MRTGKLALLASLLALMAPIAAEAKPHKDDGIKMRNRAVTGRSHARNTSGSSRSCLTSEARALLKRIENRFGSVQIISTCRPGARIATTGRPSKHASGQAIDFRVPGKKKQVVNWLTGNHGNGGTMTYSDMDHIDVDVGYHFVALNRPSGH